MGQEFYFENLEVYKKGIKLAHDIYEITKSFPDKEVFGLTSQIRRAAVSIALNIAEGSARSKKEFLHFLDISRGSVFEVVSIFDIVLKEEYVSQEIHSTIKLKLEEISKMISGLKRSLRSSNE
ncbi:MAG: four helix bundle protein [Elusimicrobia bacterium]|nr:four helix bundle protein [Elusimicrobiota bacterium]